jgi:hypothetical protein
MLIDAKTGGIGLVEMSYKSFVFYQSNGKGGYTVTTQPKGLDRRYDPTMVAGDYLIGINAECLYPVAYCFKQANLMNCGVDFAALIHPTPSNLKSTQPATT